MEGRPAKLARVQSLRDRIPFVSQSALAALLRIARTEELPDASRKDIRDARNMASRISTPYGTLHQDLKFQDDEGNAITMEIAHPCAMLYHVSSVSASFSNIVLRTAQHTPPTLTEPWHIILYTDEILPGNQLAYKSLRKMWGVYWSVLEFGAAILSDEEFLECGYVHEASRHIHKPSVLRLVHLTHSPNAYTNVFPQEAWFVIALQRSKGDLEDVSGGISALIAAIINTFFDPNGHDLSSAGISVRLHSGHLVRLFFAPGPFLADEAALHHVFGNKGSSGLKCCLFCINVFNYKYRQEIVSDDRTGLAQHHTCHDASKFLLHTRETIEEVYRRLHDASANATKKYFKELQTRLGWNLVRGSLMSTPRMRCLWHPTDHAMFDWMHVFLVSGVFNIHMGQLMIALQPHGVSYRTLEAYVDLWNLPKFIPSSGDEGVFCERRTKSSWDDQTLKCTASEGLSVIPILAKFMYDLMRKSTSPEVRGHCACFMQLVQVIEMIQRTARVKVDPSALERATGAYLSSYKLLYGEEFMVIKFHYAMHFGKLLRKFGFLPSCFVHERKHKLAKRFASQSFNTSGQWEASILRDVTCNHVSCLQEAHFQTQPALVQPGQAMRKMVEFLMEEFGEDATFAVAKSARINAFEKVSREDLVLLHNGITGSHDARCIGAAKVHFLVSVTSGADGCVVAGLSKLDLVSEHARCKKWRTTDDVFLCSAEHIRCATTWSESAAGVTTLNPVAA